MREREGIFKEDRERRQRKGYHDKSGNFGIDRIKKLG